MFSITAPPMQKNISEDKFYSVLILLLVFFHTHYNTEANLISSLSSSLVKKAPSCIIHFAFMLMYLNLLNRFFLFCDNGLAWRLTLLAWKSKVRVCANHQNNSLCYLEVWLSPSHDKGNLPCSLHWVLEMLFTRCLLSMYYTQQHQIHSIIFRSMNCLHQDNLMTSKFSVLCQK